MLFSWLRNRRRRELLATPFPTAWLDILHQNVPVYARLTDAEQAALREDLRLFVAEKNWEGCGGLTLTDEIKVTIAAQACLMLLGIDRDSFDRVETILVYPSGFRSPDGWAGPDGVVQPDSGMLGQAWYRGPVILAWDDALAGSRNLQDGRNVVLHEFAHQLDFLDGVVDGTPPLSSRKQGQQWFEVMTAEYNRLVRESEHGRPKVLDSYGASNPAEFFAVATECFFEKPLQLTKHHPALYAALREYYGQDPVVRYAPPSTQADSPVDPRPSRRKTAGKRGRRPYRGRKPPPAPPRPAKAAPFGPRWVEVWGFHPGYTRRDAMRYVHGHLKFLLVISLILGLAFGVSPSWDAAKVMSLCALVGLVGSAVWLYAAIRWIDRHGQWAGQEPHPSGNG